MADLTTIFYFVQQDNESTDDFNAFPVFKSAQEIRLQDIWENFPLPGTYHYRFKHAVNKQHVWLDINNEEG